MKYKNVFLIYWTSVSDFHHLPKCFLLPPRRWGIHMVCLFNPVYDLLVLLHIFPLIFFLRLNLSTSGDAGSAFITPESGPDPPPQPLDLLIPEAVLAFFLLLLLVWFLNREFEVSYRLHYHGNVEADKHRSKIQTMRDQAEWLLGNIIPIHVADQLKVFAAVETKILDLSYLEAYPNDN